MSRSFSGGIPFKRKEIKEFAEHKIFPKRIILLLPREGNLCSVGDSVKKYSRLSEPTGDTPAFYSGISGKVSVMKEMGRYIGTVIASDGSDDAEEALPQPDKKLSEISEDELRSLLLERGVFCPERGKKDAKVMIVDCGGSPDNYSRLYIARKYPEKVTLGAKILMKLLGARACHFAVPSSDLLCAQKIEEKLPAKSKMQKVVLFKEKAPAGISHLLISAICNLEINGMRKTSDAGYPVVSPLLCLAVYDALVNGIPFTEAYISITQENTEPRILTVPFGAELEGLYELISGQSAVRAEGLVGKKVGGVMTVKTEAIRICENAEPVLRNDENPCIRCLRCMDVCPAHIIPSDIYLSTKKGKVGRNLALYSTACFECYACSAVCPMSLPVSESVIALRRTNEAIAAQIVEDQLQEDLRALSEEVAGENSEGVEGNSNE